jgi:two-component system, LytTR family, sensor kinase
MTQALSADRGWRAPRWVAAASAVAIAGLIPVYRLQSLSWLQAAAAAAIFVATCVLLAWGVWQILARGRDGTSPVRALARHVVTALAFSAAWTAAFTGFVYLLSPDDVLAFLRGGGLWQFVWGIVIYAALAAVARIHRRLRERELAAAGAELQALRAQLNPHFLFNTLHSLTQLAREDPAGTQEALITFGGLMRYVLDAGRDAAGEVALEDEVRFVRGYLELERLRLGERLRVVEELDPDALELAVPPLLLQPLVENAVRHGVAPLRAGATLRLSAHVRGTMLAIDVADDGAGAERSAYRRAAGLGLKAVERQLEARFGDGARLEVETAPRRGFAARIVMPARLWKPLP